MIKNKNFPSCNSFFAEEEIPVCEITDYDECNYIYENLFQTNQNDIISPTLNEFLNKKIGTRFQQFIIHLYNKEEQFDEFCNCISLP